MLLLSFFSKLKLWVAPRIS